MFKIVVLLYIIIIIHLVHCEEDEEEVSNKPNNENENAKIYFDLANIYRLGDNNTKYPTTQAQINTELTE